jgi:protein-disulfide isomerase/uncharacterized membrane protein
MWERTKRALPVLTLAIAGLIVSVAIEVIHRRLAADQSYVSFCNVSSSVNCDVVLGSRYALLAGISVALWAIAYYVVLATVAGAVAATRRASTRGRLANLTLLAAGWGLLFSVYMAVIAFGVLRTVCLLCSALWLINLALFLVAWRLRTALRLTGSKRDAEIVKGDRFVLVGGAVLALALSSVIGWEAFGGRTRLPDPADIQHEHPDFYRWYFAQPVVEAPLDGDHARGAGAGAARVTIVEFSDFECGHCATFHESLDEVLRREEGVRVIFRNFPLDSACNPKLTTRIHPQACLAALAAECAGDQGKFWEYHNLLFENQRQLDRQSLIGFATRIGLDTARFTACLGSAEALARVQRDAKEGSDLGVDSTPTLFVNGRMIKGALESGMLAEAVALARGGR